jgi:hypothetical protein
MLDYHEFLALNEELAAFNPSERLRYAVHEIMIRLKDGENIKFDDMIDISGDILKDIFEKWDRNQKPDYSVFRKEDKNWMDPFAYAGYVKRKCREKQNFGKHRKKGTTTTYTGGNQYGYYANGRWVPSSNVDTGWRNPYGISWEGGGWD